MHTGNTVIGLALGVVIFLISPLLTHSNEPWNGNLFISIPMLLVAGVLASFPKPKYWWQGIFGILLGLWVYRFVGGRLDHLPNEEMIKGTLFTLISAIGGFASYMVWRAIQRSKAAPPPEPAKGEKRL